MAKKSAYSTLKLGLLFTGAIAVIYVALPEQLVRMFNDDPAVVSFGKRIIALAALFQLFDGVQIIVSGALRGAGDTKYPMVLALGGGWFLFLPIAYVSGTVLDGGVVGAWLGATSYAVMLGIGMFIRLKMDRWRSITLQPAQTAEASP